MINYVDLYVGTPPQKQTLIVDTGSTLTAFPCKKCQKDCGEHIDSHFDPEKSSTVQEVACKHESNLPYNCQSCGNKWNKQSCNF